ncbi:putative Auxin transport protein BIG [Blattamonas nauphoetae]|uniref:Auxin transport protein BIG n=1 Tax=Blattamonas nauphoetae TaxID=2049346 RepID=A0ABQ9Y9T1_9EUKA|nr:putative Auxin transport protein BIG [Blattamonas nauphoetae]
MNSLNTTPSLLSPIPPTPFSLLTSQFFPSPEQRDEAPEHLKDITKSFQYKKKSPFTAKVTQPEPEQEVTLEQLFQTPVMRSSSPPSPSVPPAPPLGSVVPRKSQVLMQSLFNLSSTGSLLPLSLIRTDKKASNDEVPLATFVLCVHLLITMGSPVCGFTIEESYPETLASHQLGTTKFFSPPPHNQFAWMAGVPFGSYRSEPARTCTFEVKASKRVGFELCEENMASFNRLTQIVSDSQTRVLNYLSPFSSPQAPFFTQKTQSVVYSLCSSLRSRLCLTIASSPTSLKTIANSTMSVLKEPTTEHANLVSSLETLRECIDSLFILNLTPDNVSATITILKDIWDSILTHSSNEEIQITRANFRTISGILKSSYSFLIHHQQGEEAAKVINDNIHTQLDQALQTKDAIGVTAHLDLLYRLISMQSFTLLHHSKQNKEYLLHRHFHLTELMSVITAAIEFSQSSTETINSAHIKSVHSLVSTTFTLVHALFSLTPFKLNVENNVFLPNSVDWWTQKADAKDVSTILLTVLQIQSLIDPTHPISHNEPVKFDWNGIISGMLSLFSREDCSSNPLYPIVISTILLLINSAFRTSPTDSEPSPFASAFTVHLTKSLLASTTQSDSSLIQIISKGVQDLLFSYKSQLDKQRLTFNSSHPDSSHAYTLDITSPLFTVVPSPTVALSGNDSLLISTLFGVFRPSPFSDLSEWKQSTTMNDFLSQPTSFCSTLSFPFIPTPSLSKEQFSLSPVMSTFLDNFEEKANLLTTSKQSLTHIQQSGLHAHANVLIYAVHTLRLLLDTLSQLITRIISQNENLQIEAMTPMESLTNGWAGYLASNHSTPEPSSTDLLVPPTKPSTTCDSMLFPKTILDKIQSTISELIQSPDALRVLLSARPLFAASPPNSETPPSTSENSQQNSKTGPGVSSRSLVEETPSRNLRTPSLLRTQVPPKQEPNANPTEDGGFEGPFGNKVNPSVKVDITLPDGVDFAPLHPPSELPPTPKDALLSQARKDLLTRESFAMEMLESFADLRTAHEHNNMQSAQDDLMNNPQRFEELCHELKMTEDELKTILGLVGEDGDHDQEQGTDGEEESSEEEMASHLSLASEDSMPYSMRHPYEIENDIMMENEDLPFHLHEALLDAISIPGNPQSAQTQPSSSDASSGKEALSASASDITPPNSQIEAADTAPISESATSPSGQTFEAPKPKVTSPSADPTKQPAPTPAAAPVVHKLGLIPPAFFLPRGLLQSTHDLLSSLLVYTELGTGLQRGVIDCFRAIFSAQFNDQLLLLHLIPYSYTALHSLMEIEPSLPKKTDEAEDSLKKVVLQIIQTRILRSLIELYNSPLSHTIFMTFMTKIDLTNLPQEADQQIHVGSDYSAPIIPNPFETYPLSSLSRHVQPTEQSFNKVRLLFSCLSVDEHWSFPTIKTLPSLRGLFSLLQLLLRSPYSLNTQTIKLCRNALPLLSTIDPIQTIQENDEHYVLLPSALYHTSSLLYSLSQDSDSRKHLHRSLTENDPRFSFKDLIQLMVSFMATQAHSQELDSSRNSQFLNAQTRLLAALMTTLLLPTQVADLESLTSLKETSLSVLLENITRILSVPNQTKTHVSIPSSTLFLFLLTQKLGFDSQSVGKIVDAAYSLLESFSAESDKLTPNSLSQLFDRNEYGNELLAHIFSRTVVPEQKDNVDQPSLIAVQLVLSFLSQLLPVVIAQAHVQKSSTISTSTLPQTLQWLDLLLLMNTRSPSKHFSSSTEEPTESVDHYVSRVLTIYSPTKLCPANSQPSTLKKLLPVLVKPDDTLEIPELTRFSFFFRDSPAFHCADCSTKEAPLVICGNCVRKNHTAHNISLLHPSQSEEGTTATPHICPECNKDLHQTVENEMFINHPFLASSPELQKLTDGFTSDTDPVSHKRLLNTLQAVFLKLLKLLKERNQTEMEASFMRCTVPTADIKGTVRVSSETVVLKPQTQRNIISSFTDTPLPDLNLGLFQLQPHSDSDKHSRSNDNDNAPVRFWSHLMPIRSTPIATINRTFFAVGEENALSFMRFEPCANEAIGTMNTLGVEPPHEDNSLSNAFGSRFNFKATPQQPQNTTEKSPSPDKRFVAPFSPQTASAPEQDENRSGLGLRMAPFLSFSQAFSPERGSQGPSYARTRFIELIEKLRNTSQQQFAGHLSSAEKHRLEQESMQIQQEMEELHRQYAGPSLNLPHLSSASFGRSMDPSGFGSSLAPRAFPFGRSGESSEAPFVPPFSFDGASFEFRRSGSGFGSRSMLGREGNQQNGLTPEERLNRLIEDRKGNVSATPEKSPKKPTPSSSDRRVKQHTPLALSPCSYDDAFKNAPFILSLLSQTLSVPRPLAKGTTNWSTRQYSKKIQASSLSCLRLSTAFPVIFIEPNPNNESQIAFGGARRCLVYAIPSYLLKGEKKTEQSLPAFEVVLATADPNEGKQGRSRNTPQSKEVDFTQPLIVGMKWTDHPAGFLCVFLTNEIRIINTSMRPSSTIYIFSFGDTHQSKLPVNNQTIITSGCIIRSNPNVLLSDAPSEYSIFVVTFEGVIHTAKFTLGKSLLQSTNATYTKLEKLTTYRDLIAESNKHTFQYFDLNSNQEMTSAPPLPADQPSTFFSLAPSQPLLSINGDALHPTLLLGAAKEHQFVVLLNPACNKVDDVLYVGPNRATIKNLDKTTDYKLTKQAYVLSVQRSPIIQSTYAWNLPVIFSASGNRITLSVLSSGDSTTKIHQRTFHIPTELMTSNSVVNAIEGLTIFSLTQNPPLPATDPSTKPGATPSLSPSSFSTPTLANRNSIANDLQSYLSANTLLPFRSNPTSTSLLSDSKKDASTISVASLMNKPKRDIDFAVNLESISSELHQETIVTSEKCQLSQTALLSTAQSSPETAPLIVGVVLSNNDVIFLCFARDLPDPIILNTFRTSSELASLQPTPLPTTIHPVQHKQSLIALSPTLTSSLFQSLPHQTSPLTPDDQRAFNIPHQLDPIINHYPLIPSEFFTSNALSDHPLYISPFHPVWEHHNAKISTSTLPRGYQSLNHLVRSAKKLRPSSQTPCPSFAVNLLAHSPPFLSHIPSALTIPELTFEFPKELVCPSEVVRPEATRLFPFRNIEIGFDATPFVTMKEGEAVINPTQHGDETVFSMTYQVEQGSEEEKTKERSFSITNASSQFYIVGISILVQSDAIPITLNAPDHFSSSFYLNTLPQNQIIEPGVRRWVDIPCNTTVNSSDPYSLTNMRLQNYFPFSISYPEKQGDISITVKIIGLDSTLFTLMYNFESNSLIGKSSAASDPLNRKVFLDPSSYIPSLPIPINVVDWSGFTVIGNSLSDRRELDYALTSFNAMIPLMKMLKKEDSLFESELMSVFPFINTDPRVISLKSAFLLALPDDQSLEEASEKSVSSDSSTLSSLLKSIAFRLHTLRLLLGFKSRFVVNRESDQLCALFGRIIEPFAKMIAFSFQEVVTFIMNSPTTLSHFDTIPSDMVEIHNSLLNFSSPAQKQFLCSSFILNTIFATSFIELKSKIDKITKTYESKTQSLDESSNLNAELLAVSKPVYNFARDLLFNENHHLGQTTSGILYNIINQWITLIPETPVKTQVGSSESPKRVFDEASDDRDRQELIAATESTEDLSMDESEEGPRTPQASLSTAPKPYYYSWSRNTGRFNCDLCHKSIQSTDYRHHCNECEDFDLCDQCHQKQQDLGQIDSHVPTHDMAHYRPDIPDSDLHPPVDFHPPSEPQSSAVATPKKNVRVILKAKSDRQAANMKSYSLPNVDTTSLSSKLLGFPLSHIPTLLFYQLVTEVASPTSLQTYVKSRHSDFSANTDSLLDSTREHISSFSVSQTSSYLAILISLITRPLFCFNLTYDIAKTSFAGFILMQSLREHIPLLDQTEGDNQHHLPSLDLYLPRSLRLVACTPVLSEDLTVRKSIDENTFSPETLNSKDRLFWRLFDALIICVLSQSLKKSSQRQVVATLTSDPKHSDTPINATVVDHSTNTDTSDQIEPISFDFAEDICISALTKVLLCEQTMDWIVVVLRSILTKLVTDPSLSSAFPDSIQSTQSFEGQALRTTSVLRSPLTPPLTTSRMIVGGLFLPNDVPNVSFETLFLTSQNSLSFIWAGSIIHFISCTQSASRIQYLAKTSLSISEPSSLAATLIPSVFTYPKQRWNTVPLVELLSWALFLKDIESSSSSSSSPAFPPRINIHLLVKRTFSGLSYHSKGMSYALRDEGLFAIRMMQIGHIIGDLGFDSSAFTKTSSSGRRDTQKDSLPISLYLSNPLHAVTKVKPNVLRTMTALFSNKAQQTPQTPTQTTPSSSTTIQTLLHLLTFDLPAVLIIPILTLLTTLLDPSPVLSKSKSKEPAKKHRADKDSQNSSPKPPVLLFVYVLLSHPNLISMILPSLLLAEKSGEIRTSASGLMTAIWNALSFDPIDVAMKSIFSLIQSTTLESYSIILPSAINIHPLSNDAQTKQPMLVGITSQFPSLRSQMLAMLLPHVWHSGKHGKHTTALFALLSGMIEHTFHHFRGSWNGSTDPQVTKHKLIIKRVIEIIAVLIVTHLNTITNHQNANIYNDLRRYLNVSEEQLFYLDGEPCSICSAKTGMNTDSSPILMSQDSIVEEKKYTSQSILYKLKHPIALKSILFRISDGKSLSATQGFTKRQVMTQFVTGVNLYVLNKSASSTTILDPKSLNLPSLRSSMAKWRLVGSMNIPSDGSSDTLTYTFPFPISTAALMIELVDGPQLSPTAPRNGRIALQEKLVCPQCQNIVTDLEHGVCSRCQDNAYQCKSCRHINYEKPYSLLCPECGHCRFIKYEATFLARDLPTSMPEKIDTDAERAYVASEIERMNKRASHLLHSLDSTRRSITKELSFVNDGSIEMSFITRTTTQTNPISNALVLPKENQFRDDHVPVHTQDGGISLPQDSILYHLANSTSSKPNTKTSSSSPKPTTSDTGRVNPAINKLVQKYFGDAQSASLELASITTSLRIARTALQAYYSQLSQLTDGGVQDSTKPKGTTGLDLIPEKVENSSHHSPFSPTSFPRDEESYLLSNLFFSSKTQQDAAFIENLTEPTISKCYGCASSFVYSGLTLIMRFVDIGHLASEFMSHELSMRFHPSTPSLLQSILEMGLSSRSSASLRHLSCATLCALAHQSEQATNAILTFIQQKVDFVLENTPNETTHQTIIAQINVAQTLSAEMQFLEQWCVSASAASSHDPFWHVRMGVVFSILMKVMRINPSSAPLLTYAVLPCIRILVSSISLGKQPSKFSPNETSEPCPVPFKMFEESIDSTDQSKPTPFNLWISALNQKKENPHTFVPDVYSATVMACARKWITFHQQAKLNQLRNYSDLSLENEFHPHSWLTLLLTSSSLAVTLQSLNLLKELSNSNDYRLFASLDYLFSILPLLSPGIVDPSCSNDSESDDQSTGLEQHPVVVYLLGLLKENTTCCLYLSARGIYRYLIYIIRAGFSQALESEGLETQQTQSQPSNLNSFILQKKTKSVTRLSNATTDGVDPLYQTHLHRLFSSPSGMILAATQLLLAIVMIPPQGKEKAAVIKPDPVSVLSMKRLGCDSFAVGVLLDIVFMSHALLLAKTVETDASGALIDSLLERVLSSGALQKTDDQSQPRESEEPQDPSMSQDSSMSQEGRNLLVTSCFRALRTTLPSRSSSGRSQSQTRLPLSVFSRLCSLLCPIKQTPEVFITLKKAHTQEEFIPGQLPRQPISSKTLEGQTFKDIKLRICQECALSEDLVQDDNSIELLVADKIIALDMDIAAIYDHVFRRTIQNRQGPNSYKVPMVVTFRLQGFDGLATEELISEIPQDDDGDQVVDDESVDPASSLLLKLDAVSLPSSGQLSKKASQDKELVVFYDKNGNETLFGHYIHHMMPSIPEPTPSPQSDPLNIVRKEADLAVTQATTTVRFATSPATQLAQQSPTASPTFSVSSEKDGLDGTAIIFIFLSSILNFDIQSELAGYLLRLLRYGCRLRCVKRRILELSSSFGTIRSSGLETPSGRIDPIGILVSLLRVAMNSDKQVDVDAAEQIIIILGTLVSEQESLSISSIEHNRDSHRLKESPPTDLLLPPSHQSPVLFTPHLIASSTLNYSSSIQSATLGSHSSHISAILSRLSSPTVKKNQKLVSSIMSILPFLTFGEDKAMDLLVSYFEPNLDFEALDKLPLEDKKEDPTSENAIQRSKLTFNLSCFALLCGSMGIDSVGQKIKDLVTQRGITKKCVDYIARVVNDSAQAHPTTFCEESIHVPSFPYALSIVEGLCRGGYTPVLEMILNATMTQEALLVSIGKMTTVTSIDRVGAAAEGIMRAINDCPDTAVSEKGQNIIEEEKKKKKEKAQKLREKMLKEMGFGVKQNGTVVSSTATEISQKLMESESKGGKNKFADYEEEDERMCCLICREGFKYRKNEALLVYVNGTKSPMGTSMFIQSASNQSDGIQLSTQFALVHRNCHKNAAKADSSERKMRNEWDGAALRNGGMKCNAMFPLVSDGISDSDYRSLVEAFFERMCDSSAGLNKRIPKWRVLIECARQSVERIVSLWCSPTSFGSAHQDIGGSKESQILLVPHLLGMAHWILSKGTSLSWSGIEARETVGRDLESFVNQTDSVFLANMLASRSSSSAINTPIFYALLGLLFFDSNEWKQLRPLFFRRHLMHSILRRKTHSKPTFASLQPSLLLFVVVELFGTKLRPTAVNPPAQSSSTSFITTSSNQLPSLFNVPSLTANPLPAPFSVTASSSSPYASSIFTSLRFENAELYLSLSAAIETTIKEEYLPITTFSEFFDVLEVLDLFYSFEIDPSFVSESTDACERFIEWIGSAKRQS